MKYQKWWDEVTRAKKQGNDSFAEQKNMREEEEARQIISDLYKKEY
jgi:hypothetical protein